MTFRGICFFLCGKYFITKFSYKHNTKSDPDYLESDPKVIRTEQIRFFRMRKNADPKLSNLNLILIVFLRTLVFVIKLISYFPLNKFGYINRI